jgi:hypothetical protein
MLACNQAWGSQMPAFKTLKIDEHMAVVFLDERFAAAFRALAYAWDGERSPDLLPDIVRECRKPRRSKRAAPKVAGSSIATAPATTHI